MSTSLQSSGRPKGGNPNWRKGVSGNPGGRIAAWRNDIKDLARKHAPAAIAALVAALKGKDRVPAAGLLLAYGYGRPEIRAQVRVIHSIADLSEEELLAIVGRGDPDAAVNTIDATADDISRNDASDKT